MADTQISALVQTFAGLGLPTTLCVPISRSSSLGDVHAAVTARLPQPANSRYLLTTSSNRRLSSSATTTALHTLLPHDASFLPLRLTVPLVGGKGGFGSQLRAAGGRMSSKRKRRDQGDAHGSSRNLDGRRMRTVNEAKALAEYLAVKPEMDRREKEERRRRWETIVEMAEQKEDEIRRGNKGKVDGAWIESKDEANERTRAAVKAAMQGAWSDKTYGAEKAEGSGSASSASEEMEDVEAPDSSEGTTPPGDEIEVPPKGKGKEKEKAPVPEPQGAEKKKGREKEKAVEFFGFDEDDEFLSDDDEQEDE